MLSVVDKCGPVPHLECCDGVHFHVCHMRTTVTGGETIPNAFYDHEAARVSMDSTASPRNCSGKTGIYKKQQASNVLIGIRAIASFVWAGCVLSVSSEASPAMPLFLF